MKISLFLSVDTEESRALYIGRQAALACASDKLAANIVPYFSALPDEGPTSDKFHIESGCRIDLLSVAVNRLPDVLYLWKRLQELLGIHCMYLEMDERSDNTRGSTPIVYSGCICEWPYYRTDYRLIHVNGPITCNPDNKDWSGLRPTWSRGHENPTRNGKPLC